MTGSGIVVLAEQSTKGQVYNEEDPWEGLGSESGKVVCDMKAKVNRRRFDGENKLWLSFEGKKLMYELF